MKNAKTYTLLASTALIAGLFSAPSFAEIVSERTTTTQSAPVSTTTRQTVTESTPTSSSTQVTTTTENNADVAVQHSVTTVDPLSSTVQTQVTTETAPVTSKSSVKWSSQEKSVVAGGSRVVNFMDFDLNKDNILSPAEIGEKLFHMYDTDGNDVIDNIEFERRAVVTVLPIEKTTVVSYDFNGDGITDKEEHDYSTFLKYTQLARFDGNHDGLSPHEFTNRSFLVADINNDKVVDMKEWESSYNSTLDEKTKREAETNK